LTFRLALRFSAFVLAIIVILVFTLRQQLIFGHQQTQSIATLDHILPIHFLYVELVYIYGL
jgi:hypothetical protein